MVVFLSVLFVILYIIPLLVVGSQVFWERTEVGKVVLLIVAFLPIINIWAVWQLCQGKL